VDTHTFTKAQSNELAVAAKVLLNSGVLDEDEEKSGKSLVRQFSGRPNVGELYMHIYTNEESEIFLQKLIEGIWADREE